jgi:hypothetical protein
MRRWAIVCVLICVAPCAWADDIDGVQPAAIDQPRVNVVIRRLAGGPALMGSGDVFNVEAFLDTGASSIDLSANTAKMLGIGRENVGNVEARFADVGVGGGSDFAVSEPIFLSIAPMTPTVVTDQKDSIPFMYNLAAGPFRTEIGPLAVGGDFLSALALEDLDIVGMPVIAGKIVVMDNRDVNAMSDKIRTFVYDGRAGAGARASIPKTSERVRLSFASFARFTRISPAGAAPPAIAANPIIGPDPLHPQGDSTPGLMVTHDGKIISGSWLLDTGAAASMISVKQAAMLGVTYAQGTEGTNHPRLVGPGTQRQFVMTVGGIGGSKKSAGFFLDKLALPTIGGKPIVFDHAPVLVADITVKDLQNPPFTLDGVFGMNFLVASAMVDESNLLPDVDHLTAGAFRWVVINQPQGWLGVERN